MELSFAAGANVSVSYDRDDDNNSTVIGAAAITVPQSFGEIFEFEFDDVVDEYAMRSSSAPVVVTVKAAEDLVPNLMDGELFEVTSTIKMGERMVATLVAATLLMAVCALAVLMVGPCC